VSVVACGQPPARSPLWTGASDGARPRGRLTDAADERSATVAKRFIPLTEVSEVLDISSAQAYALVRSGELPAIKVGGRGQWRVETTVLEEYIQRMYSQTRQFVQSQGDD
jgi:excisionase family DNA binding protein